MSTFTLKDKACIVGIGETAYTRGLEQTVLRLVLEASRHAIADAGLSLQDIDGFVLPGYFVFQEALAANLDQGPGVLEAERETIFDKFVQFGLTKTGAGETGLGLAICHEIIASHQGRIWVENHPAGGQSLSSSCRGVSPSTWRRTWLNRHPTGLNQPLFMRFL